MQAKTHTIGPDQNLQSIVDAAEPGDTILLRSGIYAVRAKGVTGLTLRGIEFRACTIDVEASETPYGPVPIFSSIFSLSTTYRSLPVASID